MVVDPASDWPKFNEKAKELINTDHVAVTFGCWTSVSRKSVLPAFEEYNALLFYPVQYEGEEDRSTCSTRRRPEPAVDSGRQVHDGSGSAEVLSAGD